MCSIIILGAWTCLSAGFHEDFQAAVKLYNSRKYDKAGEAFMKLAAAAPTPESKAQSLVFAVSCLGRQRQFEKAMKLAETIAIEPVSKNSRMGVMLDSGKFKVLIAEFKEENIDAWPDSCQSEGFLRRGTAYLRAGDGKEAVADLRKAVRYALDDHPKLNALLKLGDAFVLLKADEDALAAYKQIRDMKKYNRHYAYYQATLMRAKILSRQGKYKEAFSEVTNMNLPHKKGYWQFMKLQAQGDILKAENKLEAAESKYQEALQVKNVPPVLISRLKKQIKATAGK